MKKLISIFAVLVFLSTSAFALPPESDFIYGQKHDKLQTLFDYTGTTSGIPIYIGFASKGAATSASLWRIYKFTDSADGPTAKKHCDGIWDNRASLTYT